MTNTTDTILKLFSERGEDAYFGEEVSQLEHALQAAALAEKDGAPPHVVIAALLHDIGHMLHGLPENIANQGIDGCHEDAGALWLATRFGPEVSEPVRLHVAAKRYLCYRNPAYAAGLSPASTLSLELQGGPFTEEGAREFEQNPWFREAVMVRGWDDAAKTPGLEVPGIEHYRDRISACLR